MRPRRAMRPDPFAAGGIVLGLVATAGLMWSLDTTSTTPAVTRHVTLSPTPTVDTDTTVDESVIVTDEVITEDDPRWNCLTMGDRRCGPDFLPIGEDVADALAEGEDYGIPFPDWTTCLMQTGDTTYIVCPDGTVITS